MKSSALYQSHRKLTRLDPRQWHLLSLSHLPLIFRPILNSYLPQRRCNCFLNCSTEMPVIYMQPICLNYYYPTPYFERNTRISYLHRKTYFHSFNATLLPLKRIKKNRAIGNKRHSQFPPHSHSPPILLTSRWKLRSLQVFHQFWEEGVMQKSDLGSMKYFLWRFLK